MRKRRVINRTEVDIILRKYNIKITGKYEINDLGKIDVEGDVNIKYTNLTRLPLKFGRVNGFFNCSNIGLTSLKGAPEQVEYYFACNNNNLSSLKSGPKYVGGTYDCSHNMLQNLKGCATKIGRDLVCKMNKLKSLQGCPKEFFGRFNCSYNRLTDFSGVSEKFEGEMYANSNYLKNIKGFKDFNGTLFLDPTASSINSGDFDYKNMKIEIRLQTKYGHEFMPREVLANSHHANLILKFQRYYEIWSDDELNLDYFQMLIDDIKDGLL